MNFAQQLVAGIPALWLYGGMAFIAAMYATFVGLGTAAELGLPALLVLGLGGRFAAAALFVFNIIAVISYPDLSEVGLKDHQYWGLFLLVTLLHGPGKLSLDYLLARRFLR